MRIRAGAKGGARNAILPKVRVNEEQHEKYLAAMAVRQRAFGDTLTYSFCVREALDQWAETLLG